MPIKSVAKLLPPGQGPPVSVVILTHNERGNIDDCLASCAWCDDVHVLDSGSADGTPDAARRAGANVHINAFQCLAQQRNWAIDHIAAKYPWQFHLDADERFTPELVLEMLRELEGGRSTAAAYRTPAKLIFMNKWLRHGGAYPAYQTRLLRPDKCRFIEKGRAADIQSSGHVATLVNPILHYGFSHGLADWLGKQNRYSTMEAADVVETPARLLDVSQINSTALRTALRQLDYHLPFRALWRFLGMYLFRSGWLDAGPGFHYCAMVAMHDYWVDLKIRERRAGWDAATMRLVERMLSISASPSAPARDEGLS